MKAMKQLAKMFLLVTIMFSCIGMAHCQKQGYDYVSVTKGTLLTTKSTLEVFKTLFEEFYETTGELLLDEVEAGTLSVEDYKQKREELLIRPREQIEPLYNQAVSIYNSAVIVLFKVESNVISIEQGKIEVAKMLTDLNVIVAEIAEVLTELGVFE